MTTLVRVGAFTVLALVGRAPLGRRLLRNLRDRRHLVPVRGCASPATPSSQLAPSYLPCSSPSTRSAAAAANAPGRERRLDMRLSRNAGPEDRDVDERCILGFNSGPPMLPGAYNNLVQVFQTPGYVAILNEMVHDVRLIPLDGRPPLPAQIRQWRGDSRGHWEGHAGRRDQEFHGPRHRAPRAQH